MKAVFVLLVGLLLASAVVGGPIFGSRQLGEEVEECSELTRFKEGFVYNFTYEALTESGIKGAGPGSMMKMTCDVLVLAPERCRNVLKTVNCRLYEDVLGRQIQPEFESEMSAFDLVFRTKNGRIVEVLAHPDEPVHILNVKRAILTYLQLDMKADDVDRITIDEVTVHGNCSNEMTVTFRDNKERPRRVEVVTDLNSCELRRRPENMTRWQSFTDVIFNTTVVDKFINSSKMCSYELKGTSGEIKSIKCSEIHSFWPLNFNSESGVRTSVQTSLFAQLPEKLNSLWVDPANTRSTCLRYEYNAKEVGEKPDDVTADQAIDILKALVKSSREEVRMETPRLFGRWRAALQGMQNDTIHEVFDRAYDCSAYSQTCRNNPDKAKLAREYLLDGLLPCTTMPCFSVKNYAIARGIVPKPLANAWMVTMAFQNYPTLELMSEMLRMAQMVPSQITIFPLSIMVHNYWVNNEDIHTSNMLPEPMMKTISYLKTLIRTDCSVPVEDERLAMIALKAIGNIGEPVERFDQITFAYADKVSPALINCAKNKDIPSDISKAAIPSMRRFVLGDQLRRQVIEELFKETSLPVPHRIAAYLLAMKANPSVSELTGIWNFLKTEPVRQMQAFCFSHIENVLESSEPTLQEMKINLREAMGDDELPAYPKDFRKFSRYFELSKNLTEPWRNNTVGVQFESDLIYKPESYLPQEVMFHYVLNAFGKSWDLFETGFEMKGFEPILESVFGPEGIFPEISLQNLFENLDMNILAKVRDFAEAELGNWIVTEPEVETFNSKMFNKKNKYAKKSKREAMDNQRLVDIIHATTMRKLNELHETVGMETSATDATVFLRLLGNEFGFVSASDVLSVIPYTMGIFEEFVNKTKQIPQLLSNGLNLNTTRSFVFMDKSFVLPTGIGMPLNCSINGTTVVSLRVRSQFSINLPKIIAAGYIAPSGAVEVLATMGIDLPTKVFTGVMANSTIYHSSKVAGNVTIDGTHLQINLNNTEQPMNLFNYSTTYNLLRPNGNVDYIPGVLQDAVRSQRCTNISNIFGVDLCMSWAYPNASYVPEAPRFPFAGPNSFNVTLVNTDKALKAFTFDALYRQIKEGGAPASIPFTSIGRKGPRKTAPITKLIDTVRISFYAPGEELTRNVTSFLSIDRLRKTAQWTFTVPEVKNFIMFAGILNETTDAAPAYRAVFNVSAAENAASVDFLVRNETTVAQKNLTAVFNASINNLYWAAVGQFIRQSASGNWNAHLTETFYWDNETPLYRQILFPWTGYQINHEKYQTSSISFMRQANGPVVDRNMQISALNWAFDFNTRQTVTDTLKELTFQTRIANATWEFPLMDASLRNVTTDSGYNLEAEIGRNTHHVFAKYHVTKEQRVTRRNFRTGLRTDVFVDNPDMAMFMNSPYLLKLFGETALIDEPVEVAGGVNFTITDESTDARRHLIEATVYIPNPRRPSSDLTYNFNLRTENASLLKRKDYSVELSTPIPLLKMTNINLLHLMLDCETGSSLVEHMYTLQDTRYNKPLATVSNTFNAGWKKPTASWYMSVDTPSLTFYQNYTALYSRENGIQYFYETSQDSMSDLLDFTEISNFSIKPTAVSAYWSYIHKLVSSNISNSLVLGGPITEMRPRLVPMIVRDIMNKTVRREFSAVKDIVLNKFVYNVTGSSLTLRQNVNVSSPIIANMSASHYFFLSRELFDHKLSFAASQRRLNISSGLNYSMVMADSDMTMKTEGSLFFCRYLQMKTLTSVNATLLKITSPFDLEAFHNTEISSPFLQLSTMSTANGNIGDSAMLNVVANHNTTVSSRVGSMAVIGNFNIDSMKSPVYFDTVSGNLNYNMLSRYLISSFNSSVSFNTFRKLFKFQRVQAEVSHGITSKLINWNANGQTLLQHFSTPTQFGEISTSLDANLLSKLVNSSHSSAFALRNMEGLVQFHELSGHLRNNVTSKFVNSTYETEVNFNNVRSLFAFRKLGGSSNYVMSSRLLNVTANNTLTLNGFNRVFEFDSIIGNQIWFVKTPVMNATMDNAMALNGFRRLFDFDGVSGRISANMTSPVAQAVTFNTLLIERVQSIFTVAKIAIDSNSNFTSRPVNVSLTQTFAVDNHRTWLNFDSISAYTSFTSKVFNVSSSALNEISFGGVRSLFNFDAIRHFVTFATNSYYVNTTVSERISLENFRRMVQFDLAAAEINSSFITRPLNVTYQQAHRVEGMNGWFQYPLAETDISGNITSCWLNASTSYIGRLVGMSAPFAYDSSIAKVQYTLQSIINVTGVHGFEVTAMRSMFDFDRISGESSHVVDTPLSHMAVGGLLEFDNFRSIFNFDLVNVTTSNIFSVTPLTTTFASYNAGLTLRGFEKINRFTYIRGFAKSAILTKWTNWTMGMDADFSGFTSFMVFDHITLAGRNELRSPLFVTLFNTTNNVIGSTGFLKASDANSRNLFSISSRIAKIDTGAIWAVNDLEGLLTFRTNNIDLFFNTSSPLHNTGSALSVEMNDWRNITQFGKFEVNAGNDFSTRLAQWNVHSHFRLDDMTDVFTYSRVESTTSSNFTSIVSSLNTSLHAHIVGQSGILTYDEMIVSTVANFSSWPFKVRGASMLNIQNMAGFMRYDSISSSASTNVTSRIFNTTSQMNFQANVGTGLFKVQRANITGSLSLETPLSREIKATTTSQVINSRKLFNFDEVTMRNEFSFLTCKINVTANSESSLTNFVNLTNFESSETSAEMTVASKYFNSSSSGVVQLRGFQRLFTFERVSANALTSVKSILVNATSTAGIDFSNFERMFTFARVNSSADVQLTSRFATANGMTGMELVNFRGPTTFERLNGSFLTSFNSTMLNSTTAGGYSLENFNSLFNFVRVGASVETVLTNKLINATAIAEYSLTDSSCLCRFARLFTRSAGSLTTRFASGSAISAFELNNVRNLTSFDLFNITTGARLISKPISAVYEYEYSVKNQQWLYKFDQQTSRLHGDVRSKWLNITSMFETQMNNSNSLFGFDAAKTQGSYLLRTPVGMVHVHGYVNLDGFTNITHFVETSGLVSANVTSPLFETSGYSRFYVSKAAGILTFKKALTDSFGNFRSRYVNGTYQNSLALSGFRGMKFSEISNRFTFYWADPINQIALKNGLDMTTLQDMVQLFNITWVNPKGTVFVSQRLDYENLIASVRVPSIGVISAGASLNTYGDILSFYVDHQLMRDNLKTVNDITWFLRLNQSNVIYSNFSWNPETVSEIVDITVGAINSTFNRTITIANGTINRIMEVANRTLTHTRKMTNCTKCFMRYSYMIANETLRAALTQLNQTFYSQYVELNQTIRAQLMKLNETFYNRLERLNQTIIFARNNPRDFINRYVNLTRVNETVVRLNVTLRELYAKLRYNITHPRETFDNIKVLIKYDQRRDQITWLIENRGVVKSEVISYLKDVKANLTTKAMTLITDIKELVKYDAKVAALQQYIETRFNVPKMQEKIEELKLKIEEIKQKMVDLRRNLGERINTLKRQIAALDKETVTTELKVRMQMIKDFIVYYLNSTTLNAIESSVFIDYKDDAQVQNLMRKVIRLRPRNVIDIVDKDRVLEVKDNIVEGLRAINQTAFRYVNKTYVNETAENTLQMLREWNATFHEFVYVDIIKGDVKLVLNITRDKVVNITKALLNFTKSKMQVIKAYLTEKWDARPRSIEELRMRMTEMMMELKQVVSDYLLERYNIDVDLMSEKMLEEYLKRKEQIDVIIAKVIEISKNETHPINMLPVCYFDKTIYQLVQPPVNMTMNLTVTYSKMAFNLTKVYGKEAINMTKVYSRIAMDKGIALSKKYIPMVKKALKEYKTALIEKSKILKQKAIVYYNMAKGNATVFYEKYAPIVNETIRNYSRFAKQAVLNYTIVVRNMTDRYINMTIELLEPHVQPYRVIVMEKFDLLKARVANMKERIRNLPAQTEQFLMDTAEYHIDRYPEYKQKTLQKIEEARLKLQELRVNLTNLYRELKTDLTRLYLEVKANVTEAYTRYSQKAQEMYRLSTDKLNEYKLKAQMKWQTVKPIMMEKSMKLYDATKLRVNQTLDRAILMTKDEFSLINELPMRALDKTLFELAVDLRALINQLIETADLTIRDRESLLNYYPVKYLDMTVFEAGNFTYGKIVVAKNLTKFYANKTLVWANNTLVAANKTVFDVLIFTNKTVREVIIPYVNQTTRDLVVFLNRTRSQPWRVTLNETLSFLNETSVVLMNRANETLIMVQTRALEAWRNITSEESIAKMKMYLNKTRDLIVAYARAANETIFILRNKSVNLVIYIRDETPLLNLTKEYALLARNITRDSIFRARNFSNITMDFARNMTTSVITFINGTARDFTMQYVTYINNTMPGWMIRYYEVDQIPFRVRMRLAALEPVQLARNLTAYAINRTLFMTEVALNRSQALTRYAVNQTRVMTQFALNRTRVLTKEAINRTRTLIKDTLNTIGRLDDHSFAMNISHPFNWTSFRTVPRLSNSQIQYIKDKMALINQNVVVPVQLKIEELRNNLTVRYDEISAMVREYYELKKPIVEEKIREYRAKIEEKIEEYKNILNEYKRELEEKWVDEWKPTLLQKKDEIISKWETEIKPTFDALVANVTRIVRDPELLSNLKRNYTYFRNEYLPELRRYIMEEKYPELRRYIVDEKYPEIKEEVLARYEVAKELFEEFRYNATVFIDDMQLRFEKLRVQAEEKWTELLDRITSLKQNWPETVRKLKEDIEDVKVQLKAKFTKLVNKILSILKELRIPVEVLPLEHISLYNPWKYTAMIFGDNHVMTFDGKVYSVPPYYDEQQTYILAHDFVDRNFSLLVQKKRVTLLVRNMSVAIDDQMVVYKNGEETLQELPYQTPVSKELTIMRSGPWVNVTSSSGIALLCHKEHFLCIFHLSGWYHSKSRGLLGNVDTEYHNEFVLPTGEVTTDLVEFVRAYDVSPASNPRNVVPSLFGSCASNVEMCRTLFLDDNSVLSETFNVINRTEFYNFCLEDTRKCHQTCDSANAAITLGKECSTNVSYTPECLSCNVGEITQENGRSAKSADIIFVVSETYAMAEDNSIQDNLKVLVNRIKGKLGAFNVSDVKYGITAFGGADIHGKPHTHTVCGHLQDNLVECLNSGIDSLVFQGARPIDAMQAVEYAAHYPFRKDAAKIIILITDEELMEESGKPWDFLFNINTSLPAIQQLLDRQGITFNVFSSYPTLNKKTTESPILGVNYLGKQVIRKKSSGEEGIDRLAVPKGQYAKLATATRGSIMGLHWLQSGHRDLTYMFPRLIWKQVEPQFNGRVDYTCRCTLGVYGEAREECRITRFVDGVF